MGCHGGGLRGPVGRHTIGARSPDSSAPEIPGEAHAVEGLTNLEDVYYQERTAIQFKETGIPGCKQREVESASATRDS